MADIRVLVIEDEDELRELMVKKLLSGQMAAKGAKDLEDALPILEGKRFDVVVLAGETLKAIDALKQIRSRHPASQVIILTESTSVAFGIAAMKAGAFDFVLKPVPMNDLADKIRQAGQGSVPTN